MISMTGNTRNINKAVTETGTSTARAISLYGIDSLDDLINATLLVRANESGSASATTMQINTLEATSLMVFQGNQIVSPYENWVVSGQLYVLLYNGSQFIAFPLSQSTSGTVSTSNFFELSAAVLDLSNSSSPQEITEAFGSTDIINNFSEALIGGSKIILFKDQAQQGTTVAISVSQQETVTETKQVDIINVIMFTEEDLIPIYLALKFIKNANEEGDFPDAYDSCEANIITLGSSTEGLITDPIQLPKVCDLNDYTDSGCYIGPDSSTSETITISNLPSEIGGTFIYETGSKFIYFNLVVLKRNNSFECTQVLYRLNEGKNDVYIRNASADKVWSSWNKLAYTSDIPTVPQIIEATNEEDATTKSQANPTNLYYWVES